MLGLIRSQLAGGAHRLALRALLLFFFVSVVQACNKGGQEQLEMLLSEKTPDEILTPASLVFAPSTLDYGTVPFDVSNVDQNLFITNNSKLSVYIDAPVLATKLTITDGGFSVVKNTCPVPPAQLPGLGSCLLTVRFIPSEELIGLVSGKFNLKFGVDSSSMNMDTSFAMKASVSAKATVLESTALNFIPSSFDFPRVNIGAQATKTITLSNTTAFPMKILGISGLDNPLFVDASDCPAAGKYILPQSTCAMIVTFIPTATGSTAGYLNVDYEIDVLAGQTLSSKIQITGTSAQLGTTALAFTPTTLDFGNVRVNTGETILTARLKNNSGSKVFITSITGFDTHFTQVASNCPAPTEAFLNNAQCDLTLKFAPKAGGPFAADIVASFDLSAGKSGYKAGMALIGAGVGDIVFAGIKSIGPEALNTTTQLRINWDAATGGGAGRYYVYKVNGAGQKIYLADVPPSTLFYTDAGLTPGTSHTYQVNALDILGETDPNTATLTATTDPLGTFAVFSIAPLTEGQAANSSNLSCTNNHTEGVMPLPAFSIAAVSDPDVQCSIAGSGPYHVACNPRFKVGHSNWSSSITVRCALNGSTFDQVINLPVTDANQAPVLATINNRSVTSEIAMTAIDAGQAGNDFDLDNDTLTYSCTFDGTVDGAVAGGASCTTLPALSLGFSAATGVFNWTPNQAAAVGGSKAYEMAIVASDGQGATDSKIFVVTVNGTSVVGVNSSATNGLYNTGDVIPISVQFTSNVVVTGNPTLSLDSGSTAVYASGSGSSTLFFSYNVQAGNESADLDFSTTNALSPAGGSILDGSGNPVALELPAPGAANSLAANKALVIDGVRPTVSFVSSSTANGSYGQGQTINVQVAFSESIVVTGGVPTLELETGTVDRTATYVSTSAGNRLNFSYVIQDGDETPDLNYVDTNSLSLGGAAIRDMAGNDAILTLPALVSNQRLAGTKDILIDGKFPSVQSVTSNKANGSYGVDTNIDVRIVFSENVTVTGSPRLTLETGSTDRNAVYLSGSGTNILVFNYNVQPGDIATDLDYTTTTALTLNGGTIRDAVGLDAVLTLATPGAAGSLGANANFAIDTIAPTVTNVHSTMPNGSYKSGDVLSIQVVFSEPMAVTGSPKLKLAGGPVQRDAVYSSTTASTLTFLYTIQDGDVSADLDYATTSALSSSGGTIKDIAGNQATLTLAAPGAALSLGANKALIVDTTAPNAPVITAPVSGDISTVAVSAVSGTSEVGATIVIKDGATTISTFTSATASWTQNIGLAFTEGNHSLTATQTDAAGNVSPISSLVTFTIDTVAPIAPVVNAIATPSNAQSPALTGTAEVGSILKIYVDGTLVRSLTVPGSGNWSTTPSSPIAEGSHSITATATDAANQTSPLSIAQTIEIDITAPTVTSVNSTNANGSYKLGDAISIQVQFSETVAVVGTPRLQLEAGAVDPYVNYVAAAASATLNFAYTVGSGHNAIDLDYVSTSALSLNGATIKDAAGNSAVLSLPAPAATASLSNLKNIAIDGIVPTVTSVTSDAENGDYGPTSLIDVRVVFSEAVTVAGGTPSLGLSLSPMSRDIPLTSGSTTTTLVFNYTVQSGDTTLDLDYISAAAMALNGATIRDASGNDASVILPAPGTAGSLSSNKNLLVKGASAAPLLAASLTTQNGFVSTAITAINVNDSGTGNDLDADGEAITYTCRFDTTANGAMDAGGTPCSSLPNSAYSFAASTGILNWTPSAAAVTLLTAPSVYEFALTGTDQSHLSHTAYTVVNVLKPFTTSWGFDATASADYTLSNTSLLEYSGGLVRLLPIDQTDDDDTSTGFAGGTKKGVAWDSSQVLRLGNAGSCDATSGNCIDMDSSWAPQWANLVSYYKAENNWNDSKGSSPGTPLGTTNFASPGKVGSFAGVFSGSNHVQIPTLAPDSFTVSFWMTTTQWTTGCGGFHNGAGLVNGEVNTVTDDWGIAICVGLVRFGTGNAVSGSDNIVTAKTGVSGNGWHLITASRNHTTGSLKLYIDGVLESSATGATVSLSAPPHWDFGRIQTGGNYFIGQMDEIGIWNTALTDDEVFSIYRRQSAKFAGLFTSRIVDSTQTGATAAWTGINWTTGIPFSKELPDYNATIKNESTSAYPSLSNTLLMNNIVGLWHLNENTPGTVNTSYDYRDDSGQGRHGVNVNAMIMGQKGRFGLAPHFTSSSNAIIDLGLTPALDFGTTTSFSISAWIRPRDSANRGRIISNGIWGNGGLWRKGFSLAYESDGGISMAIGCDDADLGKCLWAVTTEKFKPGVWHHVTATIDRSANLVRIYVNGVMKDLQPYPGSCGTPGVTTMDISACTQLNASHGFDHTTIGALWQVESFNGQIDEVAVWSKRLSTADVVLVYRRGANRINFQVRSCAQADCSDGVWRGPDNTPKTAFSELHNNSTPFDYSGNVNIASPSLSFSSFSSLGLAVANARYFQYRAFLESDDTNLLCDYGGAANCSPGIKKVTLDPAAHYPTSKPYIATNVPASYYTLSNFTQTPGPAGCPGLRYLFQRSTNNHYAWATSQWQDVANDVFWASPSTDIIPNMSRLKSDVGGSSLSIKAFLVSDGNTACELDSLSVTGNTAY